MVKSDSLYKDYFGFKLDVYLKLEKEVEVFHYAKRSDFYLDENALRALQNLINNKMVIVEISKDIL